MGINEKFLPRKQLAASLLCLALDLQRLTQYFQDLSKTVPTNLVGVARWIECRSVNPKLAGSVPSEGTFLACGPGSLLGACERQPHIDVSLPLFPSL